MMHYQATSRTRLFSRVLMPKYLQGEQIAGGRKISLILLLICLCHILGKPSLRGRGLYGHCHMATPFRRRGFPRLFSPSSIVYSSISTFIPNTPLQRKTWNLTMPILTYLGTAYLFLSGFLLDCSCSNEWTFSAFLSDLPVASKDVTAIFITVCTLDFKKSSKLLLFTFCNIREKAFSFCTLRQRALSLLLLAGRLWR